MKSKYIILIGVLTLMVACQTTIPYNGEYEDERLVINAELEGSGEPLKAYLTHSHFFLDNSYRNKRTPDYVTDAAFTYKINSGAWQQMAYSNDSVNAYFSIGSLPQAGDTITLMASHPTYGEVSAKQVFPRKLDISMKVKLNELFYGHDSTTNRYKYYIDVDIKPYHSSQNDVVAIVAKTAEIYTPNDTTKNLFITYISYSTDDIFSLLPNRYQVSYQSYIAHSTNLYSLSQGQLMMPVSALTDGAKIQLRSTGIRNSDMSEFIGITLYVYLLTEDAYIYRQSVRKYLKVDDDVSRGTINNN